MAWSRTPKIYQTQADLYAYAISALGRQMRTVSQLTRLLRLHVCKTQEGQDLIDSVIHKLRERKYIDDTDYSLRYAESRKESKKLGKRRIQLDLKNKGVSEDVICETLDLVYQNIDEVEQIRAWISYKRTPKPKTSQETAKVFRALLRAGFSPASIFLVCKQWDIDPLIDDATSS